MAATTSANSSLPKKAFNWNSPRSATMNERTAGTSTSSQVLRCSVCEARVALERDITGEREVSAGTRIVEVRRVANVIAEEDFACCARCGHKHFALELVDDVETELVTTYQGEEVFARSPLKVLTITEADSSYFLDYEHRLKDPSEKFVPGKKREYIVKHTFNEGAGGVHALQNIVGIGDLERDQGTEVVQTNVVWASWASEPVGRQLAHDLEQNCPELFAQLEEFYVKYDFDQIQQEVFSVEQSTYDFIVITELKNDKFLVWSGFAARQMEEMLVSSWVASGGNILLGQWGLPKGARGAGTVDDVEDLIERLEEYSDGHPNEQKILLRLMQKGNYLTYWKKHDRLPEYAQERICEALAYPLHKTWQFRNDLHQGEFDLRREGPHPSTRANEIHDKYLRTGRVAHETIGAGAGADDDNDSGIYSLVRKMSDSSRMLFAAGYKYFKALEDRLFESAQT